MNVIDKLAIADLLKPHISYFSLEEIFNIIEIPPDEYIYTYAFPCYRLAKQEKKSPKDIALELENKIKLPDFIDNIKAEGPYLNIRVKSKYVLENIFKQRGDYGKQENHFLLDKKKHLRVVIEYPSPNTNKPLHFGHIRNMLLGKSISKVLIYKGHQVFQVNLYNDRGIHICKSMLAYEKWGHNKKPDIKSDHFVGNYYVKFNEEVKENPALEEEARELLRFWEQNDPATLKLWKMMRKWALDGFKKTYQKLGISFDKEYYESDLYLKGKKIILEGLNKGIFEKLEDGAIVAKLKENYNLENKVLIRNDGTSLYITQDIYLAYKKKDDFNYDLSIYVVADEQIQVFKWLFAVLDMLGFEGDNYHLSYGMVDLPSGKMKSREGTIVDADDIIEEMEDLALSEVDLRYPSLDAQEKKRRAEIIGLAALNFYILKFNPTKGFVFNPEESISFEGETGPYVQYCYARISSIFSKSEIKTDLDVKWDLLAHETELKIIKQLTYFPEIISSVESTYNIHYIPQYLLSLCQAFNSFYVSCQVISEDKELEKVRLLLIKCVQIVIKIGLNLLGIETLDQM